MDNIVEKTKEGHLIVLTEDKHVKELIANMRAIDKLEVSCFGYTPSKAAEISVAESDVVFTVLSNKGKVMAIFGAGVRDEAYIWLLGTDELERNPKPFLRHCRKWVNSLVEMYGSVSNVIHADNLICLRWLQWCGAELSDPVKIQGELLRKFNITVDKNNV